MVFEHGGLKNYLVSNKEVKSFLLLPRFFGVCSVTSLINGSTSNWECKCLPKCKRVLLSLGSLSSFSVSLKDDSNDNLLLTFYLLEYREKIVWVWLGQKVLLNESPNWLCRFAIKPQFWVRDVFLKPPLKAILFVHSNPDECPTVSLKE